MKKFAFIFGVVLMAALLAGCGESEELKSHPSAESLQQNLSGRWVGAAQLQDLRVVSDMVVDAQGRYVLHITNILSDGVRTATLSGTLHIQDGQLVITVTNDVGGNTMVPRIESITKIVRLDQHELILDDTNSNTKVVYKRSGL